MRESFSKTRGIINKINRQRLVVLIKKYLPFFIVLLLFILTNVFGLWNVRNIEFELPKNSYTDINKLEELSVSIKGTNIFLLLKENVLRNLDGNNEFVKDITIEKKIPSTIIITVEEYKPLFLVYSSNKCVLFSEEGNRIKELCNECINGCSEFLDMYPAITISSNSVLESDNKMIFIGEITDILDILSVFGYSINGINIDDGVSTLTDSENRTFVFDLIEDLDTQLVRMYIVGKKINSDAMEFSNLDLRFERPVMRLRQ